MYPGAIVALNNDVFNTNWYTVTVRTEIPPGTRLHDLTGHNLSDCWVGNDGMVTFGVPPGANGRGYGIWSRAEVQGRKIERPARRSTTQEFWGADDLDIAPLTITPLSVGRVWCDSRMPLKLQMMAVNGFAPDFPVQLHIEGPTASLGNTAGNNWTVQTEERGWHTLVASSPGLSPTARMPFRLRVTYHGTLDLKEGEY
jgi:hypothetical protein